MNKSDMSYCLSNEDIFKILGKEIQFVRYNELENLNLNKIKSGGALILFEGPAGNHWVCILKNKKGGKKRIEYFNSYGVIPDDEKKDLPEKFLEASNQSQNLLSRLLLDADKRGYEIHYNEKPMQNINVDENNTCGRHCAIRIMLSNYPLEDYQKFMLEYGKTNPDEKVLLLSNVLMDDLVKPVSMKRMLSKILK